MPDHQSAIIVDLDKREGGTVARVTIDNARKLNTLNPPLMEAFVEKVSGLIAVKDLRAVVLTGAGDKAFIGGADINVMAGLDKNGARAFITQVHLTCDVLRKLPVPVIGRVNGYALGAGMEVVAACDLRVASSNAVFGMPEVKVGIPSVVEAALLPGLIGWGRTREALLLGENFGAETALSWGLVERVVTPQELDATVEGWIASIFKAGPNAVRLQKELIARWEGLPMRDAIAAGVDSFAEAFDSEEPQRMLGSFAKRSR
ncbi:putative enoyl-CoA hydratase echA8 [Variibacter gotjawalensis]|uniref:Putative enoyl-CoA hydratase echA8 n=1 Tax=Variibacter gotjawalensis TaxID=1333996 RepID=A0A0S3PRB0_9BRAD|nr:enoyl-CoA hydratase [Variibacter gotjawalensis]NIK48780.1 enoyl-CoA hydratase/carnithine racemase [Variibacter gotjawalensis]RZS50641.1 enoyl-CoA hydratase/carnithine racemase [Variibacter gotjawalensis]BAT58474.1 putative enoyl-CoA hydratase echA8 [Variibacter gotjawalensis]